MDCNTSYPEPFASLAALRNKAAAISAETPARIAEWRRIREMSQAIRAAAQALKNEARQIERRSD